MPNCTSQQAAYDLAIATEAVRLAEWAVEAAEAQLANMLYMIAVNDRIAKGMALQTCLMGGMMPMMATEDSADPLVTSLRASVYELRKIRDERRATAKQMEADSDQ